MKYAEIHGLYLVNNTFIHIRACLRLHGWHGNSTIFRYSHIFLMNSIGIWWYDVKVVIIQGLNYYVKECVRDFIPPRQCVQMDCDHSCQCLPCQSCWQWICDWHWLDCWVWRMTTFCQEPGLSDCGDWCQISRTLFRRETPIINNSSMSNIVSSS